MNETLTATCTARRMRNWTRLISSKGCVASNSESIRLTPGFFFCVADSDKIVGYLSVRGGNHQFGRIGEREVSAMK
jgi:hypothetical protein